MRITHLNKRYVPHIGGVERALHWMASASVADGDQVRAVVCARGLVPSHRWVDGVEVLEVPAFGTLQSVPLAPTYIALPSNGSGVWHLHEPFPLGTLALWLRCWLSGDRLAARVLVTWHSDVVRQRVLRPLHTALARAVLARATLVHLPTAAHLHSSSVLSPFRAKARVVPFIVDIGRFARQEEHWLAATIRTWADAKPVALFVGRLVYYKGLSFLLDALQSVPEVRLAIVGSGPLRSRLEAQARELGVTEQVLWLGVLSDEELIGAYSGAGFFVLPSIARSEAFGLVQVEAMSAGLPVVSTRLGTGVEVVNVDGVSGRLVPAGDARALALAIRELATDADLRARLSAGARERAQDFSVGHLRARYRALYEEALGT